MWGQLEGLEGDSGEGHEDQNKIPLKKKPEPPRALHREECEQSIEGRVMAQVLENGGEGSQETCHHAWSQLLIQEEEKRNSTIKGKWGVRGASSRPPHQPGTFTPAGQTWRNL